MIKTVVKNDVLRVIGAQAVQTIAIASGAVTPAALSSGIINLTGEGGVADNLDTITATNLYSGNWVMLIGGSASYAITVRDTTVGSGNIQLIRAKAAALGGSAAAQRNYLLLYYDGTNFNEVIRGDLSEILDGDTIAALTITALTAAGGALSGTFTGTPTFSGNIILSGSPVISGLLGPTGWPSFSAHMSANQDVTSGVETPIAFDTEDFDTNSNFDTATYRWTPTVAGKYLITLAAIVATASAFTILEAELRINIGATAITLSTNMASALDNARCGVSGSCVVSLDGSTYVQPTIGITDTTGSGVRTLLKGEGTSTVRFTGCRIG